MVEAGAPIESDEEGLRGELVGQLAVEAAAQVAVDRLEVALEDDAEGMWFRKRGGDRLAIDWLLAHVWFLYELGKRFAAGDSEDLEWGTRRP